MTTADFLIAVLGALCVVLFAVGFALALAGGGRKK